MEVNERLEEAEPMLRHQGALSQSQSQSQLQSQSQAPRAPLSLLRIPAAVLLVLGLLLLASSLSPQKQQEYCLVIDAGSSGTRLHVFAWEAPKGDASATAGAENSTVARTVALPDIEDAAGTKVQLSRRQRAGGGGVSRKETEPGLDKFLHKREELKQKSLGPLLAWALSRIPVSRHPGTPIFLMGTAGLRRLPPQDSHWILEACREILGSSRFLFQPDFARVLSGSEEATFGWVALNYMRGTLDPPLNAEDSTVGSIKGSEGPEGAGGTPTVGALDLGGSSFEVTFEIPRVHQRWLPAADITLGGRQLSLYATSFEGYGMNDAFDWTVGEILHTRGTPRGTLGGTGTGAQGVGGSGGGPDVQGPPALGPPSRRQLAVGGMAEGDVEVLEHPCLHTGYKIWHTHRHTHGRLDAEGEGSSEPPPILTLKLVGSPNVAECARLARAAVLRANVSGDGAPEQPGGSSPCAPPECLLGVHHQPALRGPFVALAGFHIVAHFFFHSFELPKAAKGSSLSGTTGTAGLGAPPVRLGLDDILERGAEYCLQPWSELQAKYGRIKGSDMNCFRAPYMVALLRDGMGLKGDQLVLGEGEGVSWTLGAAILEGLPVIASNRGKPPVYQGLQGEVAGGHNDTAGGVVTVGSSGLGELPLSQVAGVATAVLVLGLAVLLSVAPSLQQRLGKGQGHGGRAVGASPGGAGQGGAGLWGRDIVTQLQHMVTQRIGVTVPGTDGRWPLHQKVTSPVPSPRMALPGASGDRKASPRPASLQARRQSPEREEPR